MWICGLHRIAAFDIGWHNVPQISCLLAIWANILVYHPRSMSHDNIITCTLHLDITHIACREKKYATAIIIKVKTSEVFIPEKFIFRRYMILWYGYLVVLLSIGASAIMIIIMHLHSPHRWWNTVKSTKMVYFFYVLLIYCLYIFRTAIF